MISYSDDQLIYRGLLNHISSDSPEILEALKRLSKSFDIHRYKEGDVLWDWGTMESKLCFVLSGVAIEYIKTNRYHHILRMYRSGKFMFPEDPFLYSAPSETYCKMQVPGKVACITVKQMNALVENGAIDSLLIASLLELSMTEYRQSTYELLQTSGVNRINAALEQFPDLLDVLPRDDVAAYLGISRASLFRSLKQREKK